MNFRDSPSIVGSGLRLAPAPEQTGKSPDFSQENGSWREPDAEMEANAAAIDAAFAEPIAVETPIEAKRGIFQRMIDKERSEKAKQQAIASAAAAKVRQLTVSIRSLEDALDSLLASEA